MHSIGKFDVFSVFHYFHENCNFSNKDTKRDRILLENYISMKISNFPINVTERDRNLLENLIISSFSLKLRILLKICNFSSKNTKQECTSMENFIFCTSGDDTPFTFGYRPEFSFELK